MCGRPVPTAHRRIPARHPAPGVPHTRRAQRLKPGFQPTLRMQRIHELTQRKEHNEMTSLLDRPITDASDDGVYGWHAAKLWQTRAKLLKLNSIRIISCTTSKNVLKFARLLIFFLILNIKNFSSAGKRTARFLLAGACVGS